MSRALVWSSYALLVAIWSSTWVAIKVGLGDTPPLLGAGCGSASPASACSSSLASGAAR